MARLPRLRDASPSMLVLEGFWVESLSYAESEDPDEEIEPSLKISRPELMQRVDDPAVYRARIRCVISHGQERKLDLVMSSEFRLSGDALDSPAAFLEINAPSMLLGAMRGIVAAVTSLTRGGRLDLPSVNLAATFE